MSTVHHSTGITSKIIGKEASCNGWSCNQQHNSCGTHPCCWGWCSSEAPAERCNPQELSRQGQGHNCQLSHTICWIILTSIVAVSDRGVLFCCWEQQQSNHQAKEVVTQQTGQAVELLHLSQNSCLQQYTNKATAAFLGKNNRSAEEMAILTITHLEKEETMMVLCCPAGSTS